MTDDEIAEPIDDADSDAAAAEESEEPASAEPDGTKTRPVSRVGRVLVRVILPAVLALLAVASVSVAGVVFFRQYLPNRATDAAVAKSVVAAASAGAVAVLSYNPDELDADFAAARSHLTGDFLTYYDQLSEEIVAPAARQKALKASAVVLRAAIEELHPDSAVVLAFANQSTTTAERPEPKISMSCIRITLEKKNGTWLISKFDPV